MCVYVRVCIHTSLSVRAHDSLFLRVFCERLCACMSKYAHMCVRVRMYALYQPNLSTHEKSYSTNIAAVIYGGAMS